MDPKKLAKLLGLSDDVIALGDTEPAKLETAIEGRIQQLSALPQQVEALTGELDALKESTSAGRKAELIEQGKKSGKITEAMTEWAEKLDIEALSSFLEVGQTVVPLGSPLKRENIKPLEDVEAAGGEVQEIQAAFKLINGPQAEKEEG